jgi:hypothetical protein
VELGGQDLIFGGPASALETPLTLLAAGIAMRCVWPGESSCFASRSGQIKNLRSPFQLLLMSSIQRGDGAARTDAEDEEHKPFSHASPSSPCWRLPARFWMLLTQFEAGCKLCGDAGNMTQLAAVVLTV